MVYLLLPAFNEEESIERLFIKLDDFFRKYFNNDYKILICDDGSADKTLSEIRRFEYKYPIEILIHKINRGLGETMRDLIERAVEIADTKILLLEWIVMFLMSLFL